MDKSYPYITEYAKSAKSSCKFCKNCISKDTLRMGIMIQAPTFDGKIPTWYHFECFFKKVQLKSLEDVKNIDSLRWEDQEKIKTKMNTIDSDTSNITIEYSKSNRSQCGHCEEKIDKGEIKISRLQSTSNKVWYHKQCFVQIKDEILSSTVFEIEKIEGFNSLNDEDKRILCKKFKPRKSQKRSNTNSDPIALSKRVKENDLDRQLKEQNQLLWNVRDTLETEVTRIALTELLEINKQSVPKGEANLLNSVADCLVFGCLNACPECGGQLEYSSNQYKCRSMINEWTKCLYSTREVVRSSFFIPKKFMEVDIFKNYNYKELKRILPPEIEKCEKIEPLKGYYVAIDQVKFSKKFGKIQLQKKIQELGGQISKNLTSKCLVLISTSEGLQTKNSFKKSAEDFIIDIVSPEFLLNIENADLIKAIEKYSIVDWKRSKEEIVNLKCQREKKLENQFKNNQKDNIQVLTVKGGAAVDPDSDLTKKAHLYQDPGTKDPFNAILGMADIIKGSNSFYKLQLLESDKFKKWWVFRSWGRTGTSVGGKKLEQFHHLHLAIENFRAIYLDKTGNYWENRKIFQKYPNKFAPIDIDYGEDAKNVTNSLERSQNLPLAVDCLIRFIFDMESMKQTMLEFKIDLSKMPLGKLSQKQIDISFNILKELQDILMNNPTKTKLYELSNKFYTMMPHNFGMKTPPLIDSLEMIKEKSEMIESLMEIEVAYKLMNMGKGENTIDSQYEKLHNCIIPLDKNSDEYKRLDLYLQNTHAPTHRYKIVIQDIFDVSREGESNRYHPFRKLPNRMMLWHGSRRTNWAGILSQGLRIAPPEAPVTGYMFGKGVYFADMVTKSANYCHLNSKSFDGILLLCEVALGKMTERHKADEGIVLKPGEHSCKGVGSTIPDPAENFIDDDGVIYPMGKPIHQKMKSDLLYNEYIVYDIGQIKQRYLFKVQISEK